MVMVQGSCAGYISWLFHRTTTALYNLFFCL